MTVRAARAGLRATFLLVAPLALCGCVERLIQIRSDPPGAEVVLDGKVEGETPLDVEFHWYGDREIVLRKPGFRTSRTVAEIGPPWWQIFPIDFVTDVLLPFKVRDVRTVNVALEREREPEPPEGVRERAHELKQRLEPPH